MNQTSANSDAGFTKPIDLASMAEIIGKIKPVEKIALVLPTSMKDQLPKSQAKLGAMGVTLVFSDLVDKPARIPQIDPFKFRDIEFVYAKEEPTFFSFLEYPPPIIYPSGSNYLLNISDSGEDLVHGARWRAKELRLRRNYAKGRRLAGLANRGLLHKRGLLRLAKICRKRGQTGPAAYFKNYALRMDGGATCLP